MTSEGLPITEHLPEGHEGREIYGLVKDPHPDKGRALGRIEEQRGRSVNKGVRADEAERGDRQLGDPQR